MPFLILFFLIKHPGFGLDRSVAQEAVRAWLRRETERKFRGQGDKPKTTGGVAVVYIEGVLGLPTQIPRYLQPVVAEAYSQTAS